MRACMYLSIFLTCLDVLGVFSYEKHRKEDEGHSK